MSYQSKIDLIAASERIAKLEEALTPSAATKYAYMGEICFWTSEIDEEGNEHRLRQDVPWTAIKAIMKMISTRGAGIPALPERSGDRNA